MNRQPKLTERPDEEPIGRMISKTAIRYTINVTHRKSAPWYISGAWPTAEYLLNCLPEQRFADHGDVLECVVKHREVYDYAGLVYVTEQLEVEKTITLPKGKLDGSNSNQ